MIEDIGRVKQCYTVFNSERLSQWWCVSCDITGSEATLCLPACWVVLSYYWCYRLPLLRTLRPLDRYSISDLIWSHIHTSDKLYHQVINSNMSSHHIPACSAVTPSVGGRTATSANASSGTARIVKEYVKRVESHDLEEYPEWDVKVNSYLRESEV